MDSSDQEEMEEAEKELGPTLYERALNQARTLTVHSSVIAASNFYFLFSPFGLYAMQSVLSHRICRVRYVYVYNALTMPSNNVNGGDISVGVGPFIPRYFL